MKINEWRHLGLSGIVVRKFSNLLLDLKSSNESWRDWKSLKFISLISRNASIEVMAGQKRVWI